MSDYEALRLSNIARNHALIADLGIKRSSSSPTKINRPPSAKRRKLTTITTTPTRASARIASTPAKPAYSELNEADYDRSREKSTRGKRPKATHLPPSSSQTTSKSITTRLPSPYADVDALRASWTSWTPSAPAPTRDAVTGTLHFASYPSFTPNKTPEEMLREGVFGGSYFRPLRSRVLGTTVEGDWKELPGEWTRGLDVTRFLTSPSYEAEVNKFQVACGQSIEEWEAAGWIRHEFDARGWFQWYCRFYMGRRCEDDERQVGRWRRCVGDSGRWRRTLLKKYVKLGIREVFDDGEREGDGEVSSVVSQTCFQWALEIRQDVLDEFWRTGR